MFNFPWSNFHELNLDWILSVVKEAKTVFDNGRSDIDYAVRTANEAKEIATQAAEATIPDNSISTSKIQNGAVTNAKLANNSVTTNNIVDRTIIGNDIAENTIESYNIKNGTIIGADIAESTIQTSNLLNGCITNAKIADNAVNNAKLDATLQALMTKLEQLGTRTGANWTNSGTESTGMRLTDSLPLPTTGTWLVFGCAPVCNASTTVGFVKTGNVSLRANTYFSISTYSPFLTIVDTSADNQSMYLESESSQAVTYSAIERGWLAAVKVK